MAVLACVNRQDSVKPMPSPSDFLERRRALLASALPLDDTLLVVAAGAPVPLPESSDQTYPFFAHTDYFYLTCEECPGGIVAYDPRDKTWRDFAPAVTEAERVWEGRKHAPGDPLEQWHAWLGSRAGRRIACLGAMLENLPGIDRTESHRIREHFLHLRRPKDEHELALLRHGAAIAAAGYQTIATAVAPGLTERALQVRLEAEFNAHGASGTGYGSIVGSGPNAAVLHFPPSDRVVRENEFVLIDAGPQTKRYVTDVTRTYVAGRPDVFKKQLHDIVRETLEHITARCRPGIEWRELHREAAVRMTDGLVSMDVMHGNAEDLVASGAHALFFPHGLGHMVGLGVRDAGGTPPGRAKSTDPIYKTLRCDMPLAPGYVMTVEPGLYFIRPLLEDRTRRETFRNQINWALVDKHMDIGGVRIEDNILVTTGEPENLTAAIPRTL